MSLISLILLSAGQAGGMPVAASQCPARHAGATLTDITVYDGTPEDRADLMPRGFRKAKGHEQTYWKVSYVYRAGRRLYVDCLYGQSHVLIAPAGRVARCTYTTSVTYSAFRCR